MAEKAKKQQKTKKKTIKTAKKPATAIKSSVSGKKQAGTPSAGRITCLCVIVASLLVLIVAMMLKSWV